MHKSNNVESVDKTVLFSSLPAEWRQDLIPHIQALLRETNQKVFVLDDDPTGTQTVHDTVVLTEWTVPALVREMERCCAHCIFSQGKTDPWSKGAQLQRRCDLIRS